MAYPVTSLITKAYYTSGVLARGLQTVSGTQMGDGLDLLNAMLAVKSANTRLIPYFTEYFFTAVVGQEAYFIPNLVSIETLVFNIGPVRYSMMEQMREDYWGSGRIDNIASLPFAYNLQRGLDGSTIYMYYVPSQAFPMTLWGKFQLTQVTLNFDLTTAYDLYYIEYLRYALAEQICIDYNIVMQPQSQNRLKELENIITHVSPPDLRMKKMTSLGEEISYNYAAVNIGRGWTI